MASDELASCLATFCNSAARGASSGRAGNLPQSLLAGEDRSLPGEQTLIDRGLEIAGPDGQRQIGVQPVAASGRHRQLLPLRLHDGGQIEIVQRNVERLAVERLGAGVVPLRLVQQGQVVQAG